LCIHMYLSISYFGFSICICIWLICKYWYICMSTCLIVFEQIHCNIKNVHDMINSLTFLKLDFSNLIYLNSRFLYFMLFVCNKKKRIELCSCILEFLFLCVFNSSLCFVLYPPLIIASSNSKAFFVFVFIFQILR